MIIFAYKLQQMTIRLISLLMFASLLACDNSTTTPKPDPEPEEVVVNTDYLVEINQEGFHLNIGIPKDYKENNEVKVQFDENFGHLEVLCGEVFSVYIVEEMPDIKSFEDKLKLDLLMKYEIVQSDESSILYKQFLPDGSREFWYFYVGVNANGMQYVIRNNAMGPLNEFQARKIYDAIRWKESATANNGI